MVWHRSENSTEMLWSIQPFLEKEGIGCSTDRHSSRLWKQTLLYSGLSMMYCICHIPIRTQSLNIHVSFKAQFDYDCERFCAVCIIQYCFRFVFSSITICFKTDVFVLLHCSIVHPRIPNSSVLLDTSKSKHSQKMLKEAVITLYVLWLNTVLFM